MSLNQTKSKNKSKRQISYTDSAGRPLHTFAVCAYGESPYLEACLRSLKKQKMPSEILMATSTPNEHIERLARKYGIPLCIREGEPGITRDWNFAYAKAQTPYVTLAHQDDVYLPQYTQEMYRCLSLSRDPLIFFTDYAEIREGKIVRSNTLLRVKRLMLFPLSFRSLWHSRWVRRRILSFGCPILCPSVAFVRDSLPKEVFVHHFYTDEDWEAWERLSRLEGSFVYCDRILACRRIHPDSETSRRMKLGQRIEEDLVMFRKFWPEPIARLIAALYKNSEKSNDLSKEKHHG